MFNAIAPLGEHGCILAGMPCDHLACERAVVKEEGILADHQSGIVGVQCDRLMSTSGHAKQDHGAAPEI
jgi:hypothetical protein